MLFFPHQRRRIQVLAVAVLASSLLGCRGRAQRELYEAKMAHEIRVLEDQLYEADYHNRVLIDKLEQMRLKSEAASKSPGRDDRRYDTSASPVPSRGRADRGESSLTPPLRDPAADVPRLDGSPGKAKPGAKPGDPTRGRQELVPADGDPLQGMGDLDAMIDDPTLAGLDDEDPKTLGRFMRKMSQEMGEDMGEEFNEVVDRLEKGESPESIESSMPDLGEDL